MNQSRKEALFAVKANRPRPSLWIGETAQRGSASDQNALAWSLATNADPNLRDGTAAVVFAEKAVAATNRKHVGYLETLAAAYAETG